MTDFMNMLETLQEEYKNQEVKKVFKLSFAEYATMYQQYQVATKLDNFTSIVRPEGLSNLINAAIEGVSPEMFDALFSKLSDGIDVQGLLEDQKYVANFIKEFD